MQTTNRDEAVRLSLPASGSYVRVVRLAASGVATNLGFDVDELDDLRLAVSELINLALEVCEPGTLEVVLTVTNGALQIEGFVRAAAGRVVVIDPLTRQILEGIVDAYAIEIVDGTVCFSCIHRPS